jgi:hypothetical protein
MNRAERIKNTFFKAKKQALIAKSKGFIVTSIHRYAKHHAMDCGNPHCGICGNPRKINKELTNLIETTNSKLGLVDLL